MSYALMWTLSLVTVLLAFELAGASFGGRIRGLVLGAAFTATTLMGGGLTALAFLAWSRNVAPDWRLYAASWLVAEVAGCSWIVRRRRAGDAVPSIPTGPSRGRLAVATLVACALLILTVDHVCASVDRKLALVAEAQRAVATVLSGGRVADRDNAALVYQEAFEHLDAIAPGLPDWFKTCGAPCGSQRAERGDVERVHAASQPVLNLLRRAAGMPQYRGPELDSARPYASQLPSLLSHRRSANLLALDARHRSRRGDTRGAAADIVAIWGTARQLASGNTLIEHLIALAIQAIGSDALEAALAATTAWRAEELALLAGAAPVSTHRSLERSWRLEQSGLLIMMANWGLGLESDLLGDVLPAARLPGARLLLKLFMLPKDLESYPDWMQKAMELYRKPAYTTAKQRAAFTEELNQAPKGLVTSLAMPSMLRAWISTTSTDARGRLARTAVAITAYQLRNKRPPTLLDELVPDFIDAVPIDPRGGRPVKLVAADGGLVLYGIGGDLKDDGGKREDHHRGGLDGDITFCLGGAYAARHPAQ